MDWDQRLFKKAWNYLFIDSNPEETVGEATCQVHLKNEKMKLTLLAKCLTGAPIEIYPAEEEGGMAGDVFFLPESFSLGPSLSANRSFYFFRTVFMCAQRELGHGLGKGINEKVEQSRIFAREKGPVVLKKLFSEYPNLELIFLNLKKWVPEDSPLLWGKWFPIEREETGKEIAPCTKNPDMDDLEKDHTELEGPIREMVDVVQVDQKAIEDYTLMHQYEKVETIESFNGNWRDLDGSDDLAEHSHAIDEADLRHTVRVNQPTHSTLRSDFLRNAYIPLSKEQKRPGFHLCYDEWDHQKRAYKPKYCKVYPSLVQRTRPGYVEEVLHTQARIVRQLKKKFSRFFNNWELVKHQVSGSEFDFDRIVDNFAEERAGKTVCDKVYLTKHRKNKDFSLTILMDLSLSTDGYVEGQKILDVEKQSVTAFCEVLNAYHCRFRIDGFSSQTRNNCDYLTVKDFGDSWRQVGNRIGGLRPAGYTRIGPAMRHATHLLKKESSRNKWILLLSDGKPNDFDRYEGRYGIEDVRQSIREAGHAGIHCHALAIEKDAKFYLPRMFGHNAFQILSHPEKLVEALSEFFFKLYRS